MSAYAFSNVRSLEIAAAKRKKKVNKKTTKKKQGRETIIGFRIMRRKDGFVLAPFLVIISMIGIVVAVFVSIILFGAARAQAPPSSGELVVESVPLASPVSDRGSSLDLTTPSEDVVKLRLDPLTARNKGIAVLPAIASLVLLGSLVGAGKFTAGIRAVLTAGNLMTVVLIFIPVFLLILMVIVKKSLSFRKRYLSLADRFFENNSLHNQFTRTSDVKVAIGIFLLMFSMTIGRGITAASILFGLFSVFIVFVRNFLPDTIALDGVKFRKWRRTSFLRKKMANDFICNGVISMILVAYKYFGTRTLAVNFDALGILPLGLINFVLDMAILSSIDSLLMFVSRYSRRFPMYAVNKIFFVSFKTNLLSYCVFAILWNVGATATLIPSATAFFLMAKIVSAVLMALSEYPMRMMVWRNKKPQKKSDILRGSMKRAGKVLRKIYVIKKTPFYHLKNISRLTGKEVFVKFEPAQTGHSHRMRGVYLEVSDILEKKYGVLEEISS